MADPDPLLAIRRLYHFTDLRNLAMIKKLGGIWSTAKLRKGKCEFFPGGNDWSLEQDEKTGMDSYVRLCWDRRHHMEKNIRDRDASIRLVYLEIDRTILYEPNVMFTPGVANAIGMPRLTMEQAVRENRIDYDAINRRIGSLSNPVNQARRQEAERTEIIVVDHVSMKWIRNFPNG